MSLESINPSSEKEPWIIMEPPPKRLDVTMKELLDMDKTLQKTLLVIGGILLVVALLVFVNSIYETKRKYDVMEKQILTGRVLGNEHNANN